MIIVSIREDWSIAKLGLLIRLFGHLGNAKVLVELATDELFHEMGVWAPAAGSPDSGVPAGTV